jgi:putative membrane protein
MAEKRLLYSLIIIVVSALVISGISPVDRMTWWLEVSPVIIVLPLLFATYKSFPLTSLLYVLISLHALVLILGGAYTYAHVPLGFWLQDMFELSRNPYDKIGHFMQGLVPALAAREILLRGGYVIRGKMLAFLCICVALAVSAVYEMIEWWTALAFGQGAVEFLGTQGDPWDTQSDMMLALIGATFAMFSLTRFHDRQLKDLKMGDKF